MRVGFEKGKFNWLAKQYVQIAHQNQNKDLTAKSKKEQQDLSNMNWQESDDRKRDRIMSLKQRKKNQECDGYVRYHFHKVLSSKFSFTYM